MRTQHRTVAAITLAQTKKALQLPNAGYKTRASAPLSPEKRTPDGRVVMPPQPLTIDAMMAARAEAAGTPPNSEERARDKVLKKANADRQKNEARAFSEWRNKGGKGGKRPADEESDSAIGEDESEDSEDEDEEGVVESPARALAKPSPSRKKTRGMKRPSRASTRQLDLAADGGRACKKGGALGPASRATK
jgi:hypothetical protein